METLERIDSLYAIHAISDRNRHGIRVDMNWREYPPTQFIYRYFGFNSLYSVDWQSSRPDFLREWSISEDPLQQELDFEKPDDIDALTDSKSEPAKVAKYLQFIKNNSTQTEDIFRAVLQRELSSLQIGQIERSFSRAYGIGRTAEEKLREFPQKINLLLDTSIARGRFFNTLGNVLYVIGTVRNNIFHGTKTIDMMDSNTFGRLRVYSAVIHAVTEPFFEIAKKSFDWRPKISNLQNHIDEDYEICVSAFTECGFSVGSSGPYLEATREDVKKIGSLLSLLTDEDYRVRDAGRSPSTNRVRFQISSGRSRELVPPSDLNDWLINMKSRIQSILVVLNSH